MFGVDTTGVPTGAFSLSCAATATGDACVRAGLSGALMHPLELGAGVPVPVAHISASGTKWKRLPAAPTMRATNTTRPVGCDARRVWHPRGVETIHVMRLRLCPSARWPTPQTGNGAETGAGLRVAVQQLVHATRVTQRHAVSE